MKRLRVFFIELAVGLGIAFMISVIFAVLTPLHFATLFALICLFIMIELAKEYVGGAVRTAADFIKTICIIAGEVLLFIGLDFVLGQVLQVYLVDAYDSLGQNGGYKGVLLGHVAPREFVVELALAAMIAFAVWGVRKGSRGPKILLGVLVGIAFAGVLFPEWAEGWPTTRHEVGVELHHDGLVKTVKNHNPLGNVGFHETSLLDPNPRGVCQDVLSVERVGKFLHDHTNELGIDQFIVMPETENGHLCNSTWVSVPKDWHNFEKQFQDPSNPNCYAGFWFFGTAPTALFSSDGIPEYNFTPGKWRVRTNCPLIYHKAG